MNAKSCLVNHSRLSEICTPTHPETCSIGDYVLLRHGRAVFLHVNGKRSWSGFPSWGNSVPQLRPATHTQVALQLFVFCGPRFKEGIRARSS